MTKGYSAYPEEDEVLIQDGLMYTITGIKKQRFKDKIQQEYYLISLQYPPISNEKQLNQAIELDEQSQKQLINYTQDS